MRTIELTGLMCTNAPAYLAVAGLVKALAEHDVRVSFTGYTPVLHVPEDVADEQLAHDGAHAVCYANGALGAGWPLPTTTTQRAVLNSWFREQWADPDPVFGLDVGKAGLKEQNCSAGTRLSTAVNHPMATVMLKNTVQVMRPGSQKKAQAFDEAVLPWVSRMLEHLLSGAAPSLVARKKPMLGYSVTTARAPDKHSAEQAMVIEIVELLAAVAVPHMAPRGRMPGERGERWFWWWLNTTPMGWDDLLAAGRRTGIAGLEGLRCQMRSLGGSMKNYYEFTVAEPMPARGKRG